MSNEIKNHTDVTAEIKIKCAKDIQNSFVIESSIENTLLVVVAINRNECMNSVNKISCKKALPLGQYAFDIQSDSYLIECVDYLHLGTIPISYIAKVKDQNSWHVRVPLPEKVIMKFMTPMQKKELKNFKNHFKIDEYIHQFIQMIDPN